MAIGYLRATVASRSKGANAVGMAAYRAGIELRDDRTCDIYDYHRKQGIDRSEILSPIPADWIHDRAQLWNRVEEAEKRKDARVAREIIVAIPRELDRQSKIDLMKEYVTSSYVARGMVADLNLHHLDSDNPHAHILLTTRSLVERDGKVEFGNKNRNWDKRELLQSQKAEWDAIANHYLEQAGLNDRIDTRSYEERGIDDKLPQIHLGAAASQMRLRGISTAKGDKYDRIERINNNIARTLEDIYNSPLLRPYIAPRLHQPLSACRMQNLSERKLSHRMKTKSPQQENKNHVRILQKPHATSSRPRRSAGNHLHNLSECHLARYQGLSKGILPSDARTDRRGVDSMRRPRPATEVNSKFQRREQRERDRTILSIGTDYPAARDANYHAALARQQQEQNRQLKSYAKQENLNPCQSEPSNAELQPIEKWQPAKQQPTSRALLTQIDRLAPEEGVKIELGNYQLTRQDDRLSIAYKDSPAIEITKDRGDNSWQSELVGGDFVIDQYERGLTKAIDLRLQENDRTLVSANNVRGFEPELELEADDPVISFAPERDGDPVVSFAEPKKREFRGRNRDRDMDFNR